MPVKSLMELATTACIKNIRELDSVGDFLPYENVRRILLRVDSAHQLRQIELNSPQIEGETGEIWLKLIEREFPMEYKAKAYKPSNPKKWYRVWEKYKRDHDMALEESTKKFMNAMAGLKEDKAKNTSRITDRKLDKKLLPLTPGFGVVKRGYNGPRDHTSNTLAFNRGSRTKTNTGASVMRKVRREVKEIANIHGSLSRPSRGSSAITKPIKAPVAMVNDYHRAAQPVYRPTPRPLQQSSAVQEYEERATFLSDSEDDYEQDDLFDDDEDGDDDDEPPPARAPAPRSFAKSSATSLLKKRPGAPSSSSPTKSQGSGTSSASRPAPKRSGILSNSYKPSAAKTQVVSSSSTASSKPPPSSEPPRPSHHLPRTQSSPPPMPLPGPSSPPPPAPSIAGPPRKRKAVDIFMKRKKRA